MPVWVAIVLQSLLFGILRSNVSSSVYAFIIGLLFGIIYMITKSIWVPVLIHVILNITTMAIQEYGKMSIFFGSSNFNTTEVIDTFVYNSLTGGTQGSGSIGIPIMLTTILGSILSLPCLFVTYSNTKVFQ